MRAGRLRHLVTFDELVIEIDSDGSQVETWTPAFSGQAISAEVVALSGRELIAAQGVQSKVSARIKVRYRPGLKASMRVTHNGVIYNIEAVIPDPDSGVEYRTLLCATGVNDG